MAFSPGQGGPTARRARRCGTRLVCLYAPILLAWSLLCAGNFAAAQNPSQPVQLDLRVAWGGGPVQRWNGDVRVSDGKIVLKRLLGMEADEARSVRQVESGLAIEHRTERAYDGFDLTVIAPLTAQLQIHIYPQSSDGKSEAIVVPLQMLVDRSHSAALDDQGTQLLIRRTPGDALQPVFDRSSLVFAPGETFSVRYQAVQPQLPLGAKLRFELKLSHARKTDAIWSQSEAVVADRSGGVDLPTTFPVPLPKEEGVYELTATLVEDRLANLVFSAKPLLERKVQLVVIDPLKPAESEDGPLRSVVDIDPASPGWWQRLSRLSQYNPWRRQRPTELFNQPPSTRTHLDRKWTELTVDGWHAFPLAIEHVGQPHILEIEYPSDIPQSLGISVIEPNAAGSISPIGVDAGLENRGLVGGETGEVKTHRLVFWPKSATPLLVLTNRREEGAAVFGRIRVLAGQAAIAPATAQPLVDGRLAIAHYEKPLFGNTFSATQDVNPVSQRSLDDWITFYEGGDRLVKYLQHAGYNGASISVLSEGSALFPSPWIRTNPKYDKGVYFLDGRDPVQKDVLEMLLRQFDRAGLTLFPAIEFNAPLESLEQIRETYGDNRLDLVDEQGRTALDVSSAGGQGAYYNPLRSEVRAAMAQVVHDLVERYGHHPSFGGVTLQLNANGYAQLPGAKWGMDRETVARFLHETRIANSIEELGPRPSTAILGQHRQAWLAWRAEQLTQFYEEAAQLVRRKKPTGLLMLDTAGAFRGYDWNDRLAPTLPRNMTLDAALLEAGVSRQQLQASDAIALLRTGYVRPEGEPANLGAYEMINASQEEAAYSQHANRGVLEFHVPATMRLTKLDEANPFGGADNYSWIAAEFVGVGRQARRPLIEALVDVDAALLLRGGWTVPLGEEEVVRDLLQTITALPRDRFDDIVWSKPSPVQPVVARRVVKNGTTYCYFANASPWPITLNMTVRHAAAAAATPLGKAAVENVELTAGDAAWSLTLPAYGLEAFAINSPATTFESAEVLLPSAMLAAIDQSNKEFSLRLRSLRSVPPLTVLKNPGFESPQQGEGLTGWTFNSAKDAKISLDTDNPPNGVNSLKMESSGGVAWIRSEPIPRPATGRLFVRAQIRSNRAQLSPPLRISVDGDVNGEDYYQPLSLGAGPNPAVEPNWRIFEHGVYDLPANLDDLKIGFDLMGAGDVSIDEVQVFDVGFSEGEKRELQKLRTLSDGKYHQGQFADCYRILDSYWVRFLQQRVPIAPELTQQPKGVERTATLPDRPAPTTEPKEESRFEWLRKYTPRFPRF
ncbi:family 10 glycosylhydrolase [Blastopirellula sp. JC732]|uniref:Family 10 glycosylhydrolase n=1 Tax=Blastopirellula sediminis TaxID=2894196 RepID=A0A9X1SM36_9BACT|nr:family 10 glycosylhydrolase [Blastopirellula sediminis]MCC9605411.1 family 10 glycosylhydrolase [Blastopirellula sediminis]MCC9631289.1 family 10 glycosylhydrolase [Blastopirellula sediminis]